MFLGFVHGMKQKPENWNALSPLIATSLGAEFYDFEYDARPRAKKDPARTTRMFETDLCDEATDGSDIFLIGYSLGGLIIRHLMHDLYLGQSDRPELAGRIRGVVTLGTPLHGPKNKWMTWCPAVLSNWIRFIGDQAVPETRIDHRSAIVAAKAANIPRAKFHHCQFESDEWVAPHDRSQYTEDDIARATFPGKHSKITEGKRSRRIASVVVEELRSLAASLPEKSETSGDANPEQATSVAGQQTGDHLTKTKYSSIILISCSNTKTVDDSGDWQGPMPGEWLAASRLRQRLLALRSKILGAIRDSQVEDVEFGQGNRGDKLSNQSIAQGPDFGYGERPEGVYLPAIKRYRGRLYGPLADVDWDEFHSRDVRPLILIMSGLYGFVQSDEAIQDYDVHLADIVQDYGAPLRGLWTDWFTNALNDVASQIDGKTRIFNLMAEPDYTSAISWQSLDREECSVFHLVGHMDDDGEIRTKDLLVPAGAILSGLVRKPDLIESLERSGDGESNVRELSEFSTNTGKYGKMRIAFERAVGELEGKVDW